MDEAGAGTETANAVEDQTHANDELAYGEERQRPELDEQHEDGTEEITYREALRRALREELLRDERVFLIGEEIGVFEGSYKVTAGLLDEFGTQRVREAPISEEGFTGLSTGAAMTGLRPVVEIMTINFILVAMDQVINHTSKVRYMFSGQVGCPMVIRTPNGAGNQLTAQHSQNLEGWFAHVPGLKVVTPATPADAKGLLKAAIRDDDPVLVVESLPSYNQKGEVSQDPDYMTAIGEAKVTREGDDITLIGHSMAARRSLEVAEQLEEEEISVEVIDLRSLRPLDMETVARSLAKTNRALCVDEGWPTYGVSAELCARIQGACFDDLDAPIGRVGMAEVPMPYAKNLENATLPHVKKVRAAALAVLGEETDPDEWRAG
ncbi:MAG TPA: alpha-ketoacid dehydrogenase subunit beta [Thermoleophilaceae bacterium]|nr:alpha-ketoacid dehydrogenase subunit beta [Thermoleophilaceae bacterium]